MKISQIAFSLAVCAAAALPLNASLVISEVVYNEVGSDTTGEWIEIFNNSGLTLDLSNYKIGDEEASGQTSATEALFQFPSGSSIAPWAVQIIAVSATRFNTVYGFNPTYELNGSDITVPDLTIYSSWDPDGGIVNMSNSNDQAVLVDGSDLIVDAVSWGNTFAFNPGLNATVSDGQSYERTNPYTDTDSAVDWQLGPTSVTAALRSTPGVVPEPSTWALLGISALGFALRPVRRFLKR